MSFENNFGMICNFFYSRIDGYERKYGWCVECKTMKKNRGEMRKEK